MNELHFRVEIGALRLPCEVTNIQKFSVKLLMIMEAYALENLAKFISSILKCISGGHYISFVLV